MCGRYALSLPAGAVRMHVENELQRPVAAWEDEDDYNNDRGYNIAPRTRNVVVLRGGASDGREHEEHQGDNDDDGHASVKKATKADDKVVRIEMMQWGLIPHWMKRAPDSGGMLKTINAREDTICEGGSMWKSIRGRKRCIVVAEGFYEWLHKGSERIPHFIKRKDGKLMCLAGLWDSVTYEGEKKALHTYTIVTTDCNKQMSFLHNRMPAILTNPDDIAAWLDTSDGQWSPKLANLLKPLEGELEIYPVPREVGKVGTQSPDYLKPVSERKGNIASFFAKQPLKKEDKKESKSSSQNTGETSKKAVAEDEKQSKAFAAEVNEEVEKDKAKEIASKGHNEQSHRESQSAKRDASPVKGDAVDLPLNPDEGEAIASEVGKKSQASGNSKRMSTSKSPSTPKKDKQKAIVVDDASSEVGDSKTAAIILSDLDSGSESEKAISKNRSSKRKRSQDSTSAAAPTKRKKASVDKKACSTTASPPANRAKTRSKGSTESSTADTKSKRARRESHTAAVTDHQGNKKLENFFEVKDD